MQATTINYILILFMGWSQSLLYLLGKELQTRGVKGCHKYHRQEFTLSNSPSRCLSLKYFCQE